jgi:hypothetical protein
LGLWFLGTSTRSIAWRPLFANALSLQ